MKRVLLFLLMLALGIVALRLAIGDDTIVTADERTQKPRAADEQRPVGIVQQGELGATVSQLGKFKIPRYRTIVLPDGTERYEYVFVMSAANSQPVREGLQELEQLEVMFYDGQVEAAILRANRAFVELMPNARGEASLREDKAVDLREVVFETLPGSKLEGLRLELDNALLLVSDDEVLLHTPNPVDPVKLTLAGARSGTLTGKGLQARLPRDRNGGLQRADIEVLNDPVIVTDGMQLQSRGRLHYQEDTSTGAAQISAEDHVEARLDSGAIAAGDGKSTGSQAKLGQGPVQLFADRFDGWLQRSSTLDAAGERREELFWQVVQLTGAPARVTAPDTDLSAPRLTVLAGASGQPYLVAAHGGACEFSQRNVSALTQGKGPLGGEAESLTGTSPRRIHLVLPREQTAALHQSFGFPLWTLRPIAAAQMATFDGMSTLRSNHTKIEAGNGLHVVQPDRDARAIVARGNGEVALDQAEVAATADKRAVPPLRARGNDGFLLRTNATTEQFWLGPLPEETVAAGNHRYQLRSGDAELTGSGSCQMVRTDGHTDVLLQSAAGDIDGRLGMAGAELHDMRRLEARLGAETLDHFVARGEPLHAKMLRGTDELEIRAERIERLGATAWVLLPNGDDSAAAMSLPELRRRSPAKGRRGPEDITAKAPRIELHHCGGSDWLVVLQAEGDTLARIDANVAAKAGTSPTQVSIDARRLELLPFLVYQDALQAHAGGSLSALTQLSFGGLSQAWIIGEHVSRIYADDPQQGRVEGSGRRLLLTQAAQAVVVYGDEQTLTPAWMRQQRDGKVIEARGARVRAFRGDQVRLQALRVFPGRSIVLPPSVTMVQPESSDSLSNLHAVCQGDIDVFEDRVEFAGPVVAYSVHADGGVDPAGMHIVAEKLAMRRDPKTAKLLLIRGNEVTVNWSGIVARSAQVELDLKNFTCVAADPDDVEVEMPNGARFVAPYVKILYDRMEVRCRDGKFTQTDGAPIQTR